MLIKINDRKYINSEKIESLRIISGESEHTVWINMDNDDFSTVFLSCDTLEGAELWTNWQQQSTKLIKP